jgi:hypothetical protein
LLVSPKIPLFTRTKLHHKYTTAEFLIVLGVCMGRTLPRTPPYVNPKALSSSPPPTPPLWYTCGILSRPPHHPPPVSPHARPAPLFPLHFPPRGLCSPRRPTPPPHANRMDH